MEWADLGNWNVEQLSAVFGALGTVAAFVATIFAARAARAAERSINAQFRPQIVLLFAERDGRIVLRMLNAGGPAQRIRLEADPPLANSLNHVLTDQLDLQYGYPVLLPHESVEFHFDDYSNYFDLEHVLSGRPLDFEIVIRCWAATLDREWKNRQVVSLRPLEPRTPRSHRGLDHANAQILRWQSEGPSSDDLKEQASLKNLIEQKTNEDGLGYLRLDEFTDMDLFLQHIGWRKDATYQESRLLMAEKQRGVLEGERIVAAGWTPQTAIVRLVGFALDVNDEENKPIYKEQLRASDPEQIDSTLNDDES